MFTHEHKLEHTRASRKRKNEIEIMTAHTNLTRLIGWEESLKLIERILQIPYDLSKEFRDLVSHRPNYATKKELVIIGRLDGLGYAKITELYGVSPVTIKRYQDMILSNQVNITPKAHLLHHHDKDIFAPLPIMKEVFQNLFKIRNE